MTALNAFMVGKKLTDQKLADLFGLDRSTIAKLRLGRARPSLDLALKIETFSEGAVPVDSYRKVKAKPERAGVSA